MKNILMVVLLIFCLLAISSSIYLYTTKPKIVYIKISDVYNEFTYKKELESNLTNVQQNRKTILDSLELQLKVLSNSIGEKTKGKEKQIEQFEKQRQEYLLHKNRFEEDNQAMTEQYSGQIVKQMNQYVSDYGKVKGYTYILGAEGNGAVMYASDINDISKEVIQYINE